MDKLKEGEVNNGFSPDEGIEYGIETHKTGFQIEDTTDAKQPSKLVLIIKRCLIWSVHVLVGVYFGFATHYYLREYNKHYCDTIYHPPNDIHCTMRFCNGYGFLVLFLGFVYFGLIYYFIFKPKLGRYLHRNYMVPFDRWWMIFSRQRTIEMILLGILLLAVAIFLYFETRDYPEKLKGLVAPCFFIVCGFLFSTKRAAIKWRIVVTGVTSQFLLGIICIRWSVGRSIFECVGNKTATFLGFADEGSRFVYGDTILDQGVFAFAILSVIYFFSFFISILYYLGAMQWVVIRLGWILQQMLGTTVCESVTAAANIFLGMSESPMLIRPYIKILTASEIHSIMVSGFATVSGTVLAAYLSFGANAAHLITSSVMAAPATLAISKLYMPETEESKTSSDNIQLEESEDSSILDAASNGANSAIPIVLGISANIIAFVAFIAFLNAVVSWFGGMVGWDYIDFEWLFSKLFIPLAWAMGVPWEDCDDIAKVVATKTIINEFVAYERLGELIKTNAIRARSVGIATFAICGFANPSSLGILIGSLGAMAPNRRGLITSVAFRAFIVGSIVCFISASFAGILIQEEEESRNYEKFIRTMMKKNITLALVESP
ncbi:solute carrier family 28 member 3 [Stomoxys calcitrans]|uniref:solute carrier family 28 member 3 n=1 Tax=Stomoxys calcitrans TaxID=35570 RepID=UPI0027E31A8F|nr:solute carrier family 28 member 3 [Stomoxys calcitrans]XP_059226274.1 solute carrier family 28 member 3 [Stomoxys calcitrans]XP_059226275.1 solute carrier family 28 member 3 [Stomoxys calcitrans]